MIAVILQRDRVSKPYESPPTGGVIIRGPLISSTSKETMPLRRPIVEADQDGIHIDFDRLAPGVVHILEAYASLYAIRRARDGAVELYELSAAD